MIDTKAFYNYLLSKNLDMFVGVPDSLLKDLCACIKTNSDSKHNIIAANEGNAVGIVSGHYVSTGHPGVVYMQNSGLGNTVNPLMSLADDKVYSIPMLLIIGWRGEPGVHDEPQHVRQGEVTLPLLDAMKIKYFILDEDFQPQIDACVDYMKEHSKPIAIVVRKGAFSEYSIKAEENGFPLSREEALKCIIGQLGDEDFIVSTTGKESREIFEIREANKQGHANDFLTVGSMGHTASIALGMSLGTSKNVWCLDGDGSFIMHMGGFGIIAQNAPANFKYIVNDNGAHESVGGQPTVGLKINMVGVLKACGFKHIYEAKTNTEIEKAVQAMKGQALSALVLYTHQGSRKDLGRPTTTPVQNKEAMMAKLLVK